MNKSRNRDIRFAAPRIPLKRVSSVSDYLTRGARSGSTLVVASDLPSYNVDPVGGKVISSIVLWTSISDLGWPLENILSRGHIVTGAFGAKASLREALQRACDELPSFLRMRFLSFKCSVDSRSVRVLSLRPLIDNRSPTVNLALLLFPPVSLAIADNGAVRTPPSVVPRMGSRTQSSLENRQHNLPMPYEN